MLCTQIILPDLQANQLLAVMSCRQGQHASDFVEILDLLMSSASLPPCQGRSQTPLIPQTCCKLILRLKPDGTRL